MLSKMPPRERQIVDLLYERGAMAVAEICDSLPDRLSGSAVRAMLQRLELTGHHLANVVLGGSAVSPTQFLHGDIGEVLLFDRALHFDEQDAVERYLRAKWGLGEG